MNRFKCFAGFVSVLLLATNIGQAEGPASAEAPTFAKATADKSAGKKAEWLKDYDAASKAAAEQKRPMLVLFTNSTTCAPCKMLKRDVLSTPDFAKYAGEKLILVEVDYAPYFDKENKKELAEIEKEQGIPKELWMKGRGPWPWMFVISADGKELFSGAAYDKERATPESFIAFLDGLKKP